MVLLNKHIRTQYTDISMQEIRSFRGRGGSLHFLRLNYQRIRFPLALWFCYFVSTCRAVMWLKAMTFCAELRPVAGMIWGLISVLLQMTISFLHWKTFEEMKTCFKYQGSSDNKKIGIMCPPPRCIRCWHVALLVQASLLEKQMFQIELEAPPPAPPPFSEATPTLWLVCILLVQCFYTFPRYNIQYF